MLRHQSQTAPLASNLRAEQAPLEAQFGNCYQEQSSAGPGLGEDTGKAGAAPDPSSVEWQGGNSRHCCSGDAQADWIPFQESKESFLGLVPLGLPG